MIKDGEDWSGLQTTNFSNPFNRNIALLTREKSSTFLPPFHQPRLLLAGSLRSQTCLSPRACDIKVSLLTGSLSYGAFTL